MASGESIGELIQRLHGSERRLHQPTRPEAGGYDPRKHGVMPVAFWRNSCGGHVSGRPLNLSSGCNDFTARTIPYARSGGDQIPNGLSRDPFADDASLSRHNCGWGFGSSRFSLTHGPEQALHGCRRCLANVNSSVNALVFHANQHGDETWKALSKRSGTVKQLTPAIFAEHSSETFGDVA